MFLDMFSNSVLAVRVVATLKTRAKCIIFDTQKLRNTKLIKSMDSYLKKYEYDKDGLSIWTAIHTASVSLQNLIPFFTRPIM